MVTTRACTRAATVSSKAVRAKAAAPAGRRPKAAALKVKPSASRRSSAARSRSSLCVSPVDSPGQARAASLAAASPAADNPLRALEIIMVQQKGCQVVVGVDEAGRGPLAGPVVAAACHVPADVSIPGVNDSKKLSEQQREELYELIVAHPRVMWAVAEVSPGRIDEINILQATMECMRAAVHGLSAKHGMPDCVLIDGNRLPWGNVAGKRANGTIRPADPAKPSEIKELHAVVKGDASRDAKVFSIAAASIIAKVTRDRMIIAAGEKWPQYGFADHKGYGTKTHIAAITRHGPCEIHRLTFAPLKNMKLP